MTFFLGQVPRLEEVRLEALESFVAQWTQEDLKLMPSRGARGARGFRASNACDASHGRVLLAVGPDGGWREAEEELLQQLGFSELFLGPRKLTTELQALN